MSFVKLVSGSLKFTLPPAMLGHVQVQMMGPGAMKVKIEGDPSGAFTFATCPPPQPPNPPDQFKMLPAGAVDVHHFQSDPGASRTIKVSPFHENGAPCPPSGGIDPNDKFITAIEVWEYQDPNDPRRQMSSWSFLSTSGSGFSAVIIIEPDSSGGTTPKRLMKEKPFKQMNALLPVMQASLQALLGVWDRELRKIK